VSDFQICWSVLVRDPYLFLGLLIVFVPVNVGFWRMYKKLSEAGFKNSSRFAFTPIWWEAYGREYARTRAKHGWPAWPLHVMWLSFLIGIPLVVFGVSKL
jgi:hypothetical protein